MVERLSNQPGMVAAGITSVIPSSGMSPLATYTIEGQPEEGWKLKFAMFATTYGDYFHAMGIPLLDGRTFTEEDNAGTPLVVIVNQSMARHSWPGERAVGKRMHVGNPKKGLPWATVVGVVADTRLGARDEPAMDQWYSPLQQPAILNGVDASETLPNRLERIRRAAFCSSSRTDHADSTVWPLPALIRCLQSSKCSR